jgi:hypothetical protein
MDGFLSNNIRDIIAIVGLGIAIIGILVTGVKQFLSKSSGGPSPVGKVAPLAATQGSRAPWDIYLANFLTYCFIGMMFFSIPIGKEHENTWGLGFTLTSVLLTGCSMYLQFLVRATKKSIGACLRKAYLNFFTFCAVMIWLMWIMGYFPKKN